MKEALPFSISFSFPDIAQTSGNRNTSWCKMLLVFAPTVLKVIQTATHPLVKIQSTTLAISNKAHSASYQMFTIFQEYNTHKHFVIVEYSTPLWKINNRDLLRCQMGSIWIEELQNPFIMIDHMSHEQWYGPHTITDHMTTWPLCHVR